MHFISDLSNISKLTFKFNTKKISNVNCPIIELPNEILEYIFSFLSKNEKRDVIPFVCKKFYVFKQNDIPKDSLLSFSLNHKEFLKKSNFFTHLSDALQLTEALLAKSPLPAKIKEELDIEKLVEKLIRENCLIQTIINLSLKKLDKFTDDVSLPAYHYRKENNDIFFEDFYVLWNPITLTINVKRTGENSGRKNDFRTRMSFSIRLKPKSYGQDDPPQNEYFIITTFIKEDQVKQAGFCWNKAPQEPRFMTHALDCAVNCEIQGYINYIASRNFELISSLYTKIEDYKEGITFDCNEKGLISLCEKNQKSTSSFSLISKNFFEKDRTYSLYKNKYKTIVWESKDSNYSKFSNVIKFAVFYRTTVYLNNFLKTTLPKTKYFQNNETVVVSQTEWITKSYLQ